MVDKLSYQKISPSSIEEVNRADNPSDRNPEWVKAAQGWIVKKVTPKLTILQWLSNRVSMLTRIPLNKIRETITFKRITDSDITYAVRGEGAQWGFTCEKCDQRYKRYSLLGGIPRFYASRCKDCNTQHQRYKRARRGMEKITRDLKARPGLKCWFITLTKPNIIFRAGDTVDLEADKADWITEFRNFRRRSVWKDTFSGGYWFYEYTIHEPGEKIFDKANRFVRQCKDFELNGHLHILATAESRIPMKELAQGWEGRVDFRSRDRKTNRPIDEKTIMRYLRGYLTKSTSSGVNMRPFGDIHRKST